jgi:hypothetical protein
MGETDKEVKQQSSQWMSKSSPWLKKSMIKWMWRLCSFSSTTEVWCFMNSFLETKQWIEHCMGLFYDIYKKQYERNDLKFAGTQPVLSQWRWTHPARNTTDAHTAPHLKVSCEKSTPLLPQPLYSHILSQTEFILCPELEVSLKTHWSKSVEKSKWNARTFKPYLSIIVHGMLREMGMSLKVY